MGTINYSLHHPVTGNVFVVTWASLSTSSNALDTGQAFPASTDLALLSGLFSDKSVQWYKPSGADTLVLIEGSNQANLIHTSAALTFASLTDPQGNALNLTTVAGLEAILENTFYVRPRVTTTSATTMGMTIQLLFSSVRSSRSGV